MKNCFHHSMPPPGGGYLLQRILACGKLHRRPECVFLCPDLLPRDAQPPFSMPDAAVCGTPQWQELPRRGCRGLTLLVNVPVALRLQDRCGCVFQAELPLEAELTLHERFPEKESWRGQVFIQSAVRPWNRSIANQGNDREVALEWLVEGLSPCPVSGGPCCPDPRPLYPRLDHFAISEGDFRCHPMDLFACRQEESTGFWNGPPPMRPGAFPCGNERKSGPSGIHPDRFPCWRD